MDIKFKKFKGTESELDSLYSNSKYDEPFWVETDHGIYEVSLAWEQGRNNNYRFTAGDDIIWPEYVTHVEQK
ncbi:hypothetical protein MYO4S_00117 [Serratia phage 4S]|nr:hypothetical protein MYO4S_00117 [Serratia phage 4S]